MSPFARKVQKAPMKFKKQDLKWETHKTVYNRITSVGRWSVNHERVFEHEGRFYLTTYSVGATECQDESPYDYEPDEIFCQEVFPKEKTITVYEP